MTEKKNPRREASEGHASERQKSEREKRERAAKEHDDAIDRAEERLIDAGSEMSFPASDPPSFMGGAAVAGAPPRRHVRREGVSTELVDAQEAEPGPPLAPEPEDEDKAERARPPERASKD